MKLRIRDNSLRLRLTRSEIERIGKGEAIISAIQLGSTHDQCLMYRLESCPDHDAVEVSFLHNVIRIVVPQKEALAWSLGTDVGIYCDHITSRGELLKILIEKDFFCLKPRSHEQEDESDMFPNPNMAHGRCG